MIELRQAVHGRKVRTDEARAYRLTVSEVLPIVTASERSTARICARLDPLRVKVRDESSGAADGLLGLTSTRSTYGPRWWIVCPKCGKRASAVYWIGHRDGGRWACWKCANLQPAAAALRRTPEGDRLILSGQLNATRRTREAVRQREKRRLERSLRTLTKQLGG